MLLGGGGVSLLSEDFVANLIGADWFRFIFNNGWVTALGAAIFLVGLYYFFAEGKISN